MFSPPLLHFVNNTAPEGSPFCRESAFPCFYASDMAVCSLEGRVFGEVFEPRIFISDCRLKLEVWVSDFQTVFLHTQ